MNSEGTIYELPPERLTPEQMQDSARLDGYLRGRAEESKRRKAMRKAQKKARKHGRPC